MKITVQFEEKDFEKADLKVLGAYSNKDETAASFSWSDKNLLRTFKETKGFNNFLGKKGEHTLFTGDNGEDVFVVGLGTKAKAKAESIRRSIATSYKAFESKKYKNVSIDMQSFNSVSNITLTTALAKESLLLTSYKFDKHFKENKKSSIEKVFLFVNDKKAKRSMDKAINEVTHIADSVNITRDLVNEAPNILNSVSYAKIVEKDVKDNLKGVKTKILGKTDLKKEKMGLFLSVNAGSAHDPRLVHLTYTPKKVTKNTKHIALVGKGLTFDTGGYSLKPAASIAGMKFDMGGSATVYGAFRAAVLNNSPYKITCVLGMTDNAVNEHATMPDSIVKARNGLSVEILNTDAEGRLVMADCLDYVCDLKPNVVINAATLTGACLVALGTEVAALLGNSDKTMKALLSSAKQSDEYMWQLPIVDEWRQDMKSHVADLRNIGSSRFAGTAKAAAFLENFIKNDVEWAHLDIAGVCDSQKHLPYCPAKGGSGIIVRTLHHYLMNAK